eukprot:g2459.t1
MKTRSQSTKPHSKKKRNGKNNKFNRFNRKKHGKRKTQHASALSMEVIVDKLYQNTKDTPNKYQMTLSKVVNGTYTITMDNQEATRMKKLVNKEQFTNLSQHLTILAAVSDANNIELVKYNEKKAETSLEFSHTLYQKLVELVPTSTIREYKSYCITNFGQHNRYGSVLFAYLKEQLSIHGHNNILQTFKSLFNIQQRAHQPIRSFHESRLRMIDRLAEHYPDMSEHLRAIALILTVTSCHPTHYKSIYRSNPTLGKDLYKVQDLLTLYENIEYIDGLPKDNANQKGRRNPRGGNDRTSHQPQSQQPPSSSSSSSSTPTKTTQRRCFTKQRFGHCDKPGCKYDHNFHASDQPSEHKSTATPKSHTPRTTFDELHFEAEDDHDDTTIFENTDQEFNGMIFTTVTRTTPNVKHRYLLDSGATKCVVANPALRQQDTDTTIVTVKGSLQGRATVTTINNINIPTLEIRSLPNQMKGIIAQQAITLLFPQSTIIYREKGVYLTCQDVEMKIAVRQHNLYWLLYDLKSLYDKMTAKITHPRTTAIQQVRALHRRLMHPGVTEMYQYSKALPYLPASQFRQYVQLVFKTCITCIESGRHHPRRSPSTPNTVLSRASPRPPKPGTWADLLGPFNTRSRQGSSVYIMIKSRLPSGVLHFFGKGLIRADQNETIRALKQWKRTLPSEHRSTLLSLPFTTDPGSNFSTFVTAWLGKQDITHHIVPTNTHVKDIETEFRTARERITRAKADSTPEFWEYLLNQYIFIKNNSRAHLPTFPFFYKCMTPTHHLAKDLYRDKGYLVRFLQTERDMHHYAHICYNESTSSIVRVHTLRALPVHLQFDPEAKYISKGHGHTNRNEKFFVTTNGRYVCIHCGLSAKKKNTIVKHNCTAVLNETRDSEQPPINVNQLPASNRRARQTQRHRLGRAKLPKSNSTRSTRSGASYFIEQAGPPRYQLILEGDYNVNDIEVHPDTTPPKSIRGANQKFLNALGLELQKFNRHHAFSKPSSNPKVTLRSNVLFTVKHAGHRADTFIAKARLYLRGDQQPPTAYTQTSSPVVRHSTIKLFLVTSYSLRNALLSADYTAAYLNASSDVQEINVKFPRGIVLLDTNSGDTYQEGLNEVATPGMKQSGYCWNISIDYNYVNELGFQRSKEDDCLYYRRSPNGIILLIIYTDDILVSYPPRDQQLVTTLLQSSYPLRINMTPTMFLGTQITLTSKDISFNVSEKIQKLYNTYPSKLRTTPLPYNYKEKLQHQYNPIPDKRIFQSITGSIGWLTNERPDIGYAHSILATFNNNPNEYHLYLAQHVISYLQNTSSFGYRYQSDIAPTYPIPLQLTVTCDASFADRPDMTSTMAVVVQLNQCTILAKCSKQRTISLSTTEAELYALNAGAKYLVYFDRLVQDLCQFAPSFFTYHKPIIMTDNISALTVASPNHSLWRKTRHINIRRMFVRSLRDSDQYIFRHVATTDNLANAISKALPRTQHQFEFERLLTNKLYYSSTKTNATSAKRPRS